MAQVTTMVCWHDDCARICEVGNGDVDLIVAELRDGMNLCHQRPLGDIVRGVAETSVMA